MNAANDTARARRSLAGAKQRQPFKTEGRRRCPVLDLANSADENGSLVTVDPVDWIICFVPGLQRQWWHRFVHHKHKHVFAMRPTNTGSWLLVEPWWSRMMVTILPPADAVKFLRWGGTGDILRVREQSQVRRASFAVGQIARFSRRLCLGGRAGHGRRTVSIGNYSARRQRGART